MITSKIVSLIYFTAQSGAFNWHELLKQPAICINTLWLQYLVLLSSAEDELIVWNVVISVDLYTCHFPVYGCHLSL